MAASSSSDVISVLQKALATSSLASGGSASFYKGQNSSLLPSQIDDSQYHKGINVTTRKGYLSPRPGYIQQKFTVINDAPYTDSNGANTTLEKVFRRGKFQGACNYHTPMGEKIVAVYSGLIFILYPKKKTAQYIEIELEKSHITSIEEQFEPATQRLNQYARRLNFSQAGDKLVIFDYPDRPVIIDGYRAYRSPIGQTDTVGNPVYYVPATVMGCYNSNRLFVCSTTNEFTAGDPVGSLLAPNAPVTFNELYQNAGEYRGQTFSLGSTNKNNPITAMGFLQVTDNSTGIGPMYVATKDAIYAYRTDLPRSVWATGDSPFGVLVLYNAGIIGPKAVTNLNSDLFFMSADGHIRSYTVSKEYTGTWENTPIDLEVWDWVNSSSNLKDLTVITYFGNKVFCTVKPHRVKAKDLYGNTITDYAFKGMVVLELDGVSGLSKDSSPAWAGVWTGVGVQDLVVCEDELYIFAKDPVSTNEVYKLDLEATQDFYEGESKPIRCRVYTKQYGLDSYFKDKKERSIILGLQNLEGDVHLELSRSNDYSQYSIWKIWDYTAPVCKRTDPVSLSPHFFRELNFGSADEVVCNPVTGEYGDVYRGVQFQIDISAPNWRLDHILIISDEQRSDYSDTVCSLEDNVEAPLQCVVSDLEMYHTANYVEEEWQK